MTYDCPSCDRSFDSNVGLKVHHSRTHGESIAGEPVNCTWCEKEFRTNAYNIENQENNFCSKNCQHKWQSEKWSGDGSPRSTLEPVDCDICGDKLMLPKWHREKSDYFLCSDTCRAIKQYRRLYEGYGRDYGEKWSEARKKTRERFDHTCVNCGDECGIMHHDVHHIKPVKEFENPNKAHFDDNLLLLCKSCHKSIEHLSECEQKSLSE